MPSSPNSFAILAARGFFQLRATCLALTALLTLLLASPFPAFLQSLRELADRAGVLIGTAVRPSQFLEASYSSTLGREFNMVEAEDVMKWWVVRPDPATFDFTQGDQVVAFARVHNMKVRGHALVWAWSNPPWLMDGHFTPEQSPPCSTSTFGKLSPTTAARSSPGTSSTKPSTSTTT